MERPRCVRRSATFSLIGRYRTCLEMKMMMSASDIFSSRTSISQACSELQPWCEQPQLEGGIADRRWRVAGCSKRNGRNPWRVAAPCHAMPCLAMPSLAASARRRLSTCGQL